MAGGRLRWHGSHDHKDRKKELLFEPMLRGPILTAPATARCRKNVVVGSFVFLMERQAVRA